MTFGWMCGCSICFGVGCVECLENTRWTLESDQHGGFCVAEFSDSILFLSLCFVSAPTP